ncbi:ABC transporter permease [Silvibacterium acidisoli]|uniref:ABC transporter permease n=1 Tax=Acidobacteriaceae bacterium ZG23-2 TaxID=2883246 RepID=UPI00406D0721
MLLLISVGEGFRSGNHRQLASFGNDLIMMWSGNIPAVPNQHTGMRPYYLTLGDAEAMRTELPDVRAAVALVNNDDIKQQSQYQTVGGTVVGTEPGFSSVRFMPLTQGRFLNDGDILNRNHVVVLGQKSAEMLFPGRNAMGEYITLNGTRFEVIGIADKMGHGNNDGDNQKIYIPISAMLEMFPLKGDNVPRDAVSSVQYQPRVHGDNVIAKQQVHQLIARRHGFDASATEAFNEWDTIESEQMVGKIFTAMDVFLGGVGVVTLALGAVGIVNIMLVSVSERTREIGLRKAIGATSRSILFQFFLEGLILTGISGLIGIGGSALFMFLLQKVVGNSAQGFDPPHLQPWSAALAMGSLSICGILAGLYPAAKAAALEPVEALRRE